MFQEVDISTWSRKATYEFFRDYEDPFFNVTANLDVTNLYRFCKQNDLAFSLAALFFSIQAANEIRELRLRIIDDVVVEFGRVEATQTILNDDETFSFCYFPLKDDVFEFDRSGKTAREKYKALKSFDVETDRVDLIYYSAIPWISFTSFKHASRQNNRQSVPRMVFGRMFEDGPARKMPFSVEVHHALVDGVHVGKFYNLFQAKLDSV
ncbi:MAG TPA: chloramphenicol acetyltransferase [Pyrinomonadaceae bacterium]|nr:chloramphenicol acetyltransferase [Pyrinomonadaceae bacterium]